MPQLSNLNITGSLVAGYVVTVTTNVAKGTAYLVAVPAGEEAPSKVQITAGQNYQGTVAVAQQTPVDSTNISFPAITDFSPGTSYDVHCIHDASPVISGLIEGMDATATPAGISMPAKGVEFIDPIYGTSIYRITDHVNDLAGSGLSTPSWIRNLYSRIQSLNADGTYFLFFATDGYWHLYDATTYAWVRQVSLGGGSTEPQWHPTDPQLVYKFPNNGGMSISTHNVLTDEVIQVADFTNVAAIEGDINVNSIVDVFPTAARCWTKSEGSPSADGRYWGLMVEDGSFITRGLMVYDMQLNEVVGTYDFATDGAGISDVDHCSMSPSGDWIVPSWHQSAGADCSTIKGGTFDDPLNRGTLTEPCGLMAFNRDFTVAVPIAELGPHSDIGLNELGEDVMVYVDYQFNQVANDDGMVRMTNLHTGVTTDLFSMYNGDGGGGIHFSAKNYDKPGWFLISTYGTTVSWFEQKLFAVEMKANPKVYVLAHSHWAATDNAYWGETHAVASKDFDRVIFNSTWDSAFITDSEVFEVQINPADLVGSV